VPSGVTYRDLDNVAWEVAKAHNSNAKVSFELIARLTSIYNNKDKISNLDEEIGKVLLNYDSRKSENARTALILISDNGL
jgi:hypothetical protein